MLGDLRFKLLQPCVEVAESLRVTLTELLNASDECQRQRVYLSSDTTLHRGMPLIVEYQGFDVGLGQIVVLF